MNPSHPAISALRKGFPTWTRAAFLLGSLLCLGHMSGGSTEAAPLTTLEYRITGSSLAVSPSSLSVPKGIAGSVAVEVSADPALTQGAFVAATLRGPSFAARELLAAPGQPLLLPPLSLVGDYQLDNIRLARLEGGKEVTLLEGVPASVPVRVFDEVLVTKVTSRPLSSTEIQEKGIFLDEQNFRVTEFEVGFVLDGKTIPVRLPVVAPRAIQSTEIIPAAELEERLKQAEAANRDIGEKLQLPEAVRLASIQVQPVNFQVTEEGDGASALQIPPIPALLVIPGNIGFLNQFFSVQVFTENAAPGGSGLSVANIRAGLLLPPGPDGLPASSFASPGDDPLRFARVGADRAVQTNAPVVRPGADGRLGTPDDIGRLQPGEGGQAEFLVEGLQEGLHVMELRLTADLEGLAAGVVRITGKAAGSVLVRNPKFSLAFTHPRTVRSQEPYAASVTILNTGLGTANFVRVTLPAAALSGAALESAATVELGDILPGQSATARWTLRAQRTGKITFSNLTFGADAVAGRFNLVMGIDERGVELSPDTIAMPEDVDRLPLSVQRAAERVLGQALSAATAPIVPAGVLRVDRQHVKNRVIELAEAGQRLRFGDGTNRVLLDLLLDWQGGRIANDGFDQILRENDAGREWRDALLAELLLADGRPLPDLLAGLAPDIAGRAERAVVLTDDFADAGTAQDWLTAGLVTTRRSEVARALGYGRDGGALFLQQGEVPGGTNTWRFTNGIPGGAVRFARFAPDGRGDEFSWTVPGLPAGARAELDFAAAPPVLRLDRDGDGTADETLAGGHRGLAEAPPRVVGVIQDVTVIAGRPALPCAKTHVLNYGTTVGVLFSKPMTQATLDRPAGYLLDDGNTGRSVQIQSGGRLALLNLARGVSAIRPRRLRVEGVADPRGNLVVTAPLPVRHEYDGRPFREGVAVNGRVLRGDGSPATGVPVTLTMEDEVDTLNGCLSWVFRPSQVSTDANGEFSFDYVLAGVRFIIGVTDTAALSATELARVVELGDGTGEVRARLLELAAQSPATLLSEFAVGSLPQAIAKVEGLDRATFSDVVSGEREGGTNFVALRFRGRGTVTGVVLAADGAGVVPGAAVNLFPDPASRELGRGVISDDQGRFAFYGVPLGAFSVDVRTGSGPARTVAEVITVPGETKDLRVVLSAAAVARGDLAGRVTEADLVTAHAGADVFVSLDKMVVARTKADADGNWSVRAVPGGTLTVAALSVDGRRSAQRGQTLGDRETANVNLALGGFAAVTGRVLTSAGVPLTNALVAGGIQLVTTDGAGRFLIPDAPVGRRGISAGVTPERSAQVRFQRSGSASVNVLPGVLNVADVIMEPAGLVQGVVRDEAGRPVPHARVARPIDSDPPGFFWVDADADGFYRFENVPPGSHTFSAPAPPVEETFDAAAALATLRGGPSEAELGAVIQKAFAAFTGADNPLLNGEGANFDPKRWGFANAAVRFDGDVVTADVQFFRRGTVTGQVLNGQDVPIGAKVRLTGLKPAPNGSPQLSNLQDLDSDPATGEFAFPDSVFYGSAGVLRPGQVTPGTFGLQAASPFFPVVLSEGGLLTAAGTREHRVLKFPPPSEIQGNIAGQVFNPDGSPAPAGTRILVPAEGSIRPDLRRGFVPEREQTGETYNQQVGAEVAPGVTAVPPDFPPTVKIPARKEDYDVVAFDPATGLFGLSRVNVVAGITNRVTVRLLGRGGARVRVVFADGSPAAGAEVTLNAGPHRRRGRPGVRQPDPERLQRRCRHARGRVADLRAGQPHGPARGRGRGHVDAATDGEHRGPLPAARPGDARRGRAGRRGERRLHRHGRGRRVLRRRSAVGHLSRHEQRSGQRHRRAGHGGAERQRCDQ